MFLYRDEYGYISIQREKIEAGYISIQREKIEAKLGYTQITPIKIIDP